MKNIVQHWFRRKGAQTSARNPQLQMIHSILAVQHHVTPPGWGARLWSQSTAEVCLWWFENAGKPINSLDTSSSPAHPSWNLVWRFNPCWILKVVQAVHAEVHLFAWCSSLSCLVTAGPLAHFRCWSGIEWYRIRKTKTKQLKVSFYLFLTSADQWCRFFWSVFVSSRGRISFREFILISCWRQSPPHAPSAASSSVPSTQKLVSLKEGASPTSLWKKAASCQVSLVTATAPLNTYSSSSEGTGFTKAEKSYTFYCRFSVSVLESTAALEADIVPTSLPHMTLPQTQPQATPKFVPGFAVQTSVPVRTKTLTWLVTEEQ